MCRFYARQRLDRLHRIDFCFIESENDVRLLYQLGDSQMNEIAVT